MKGTKVMVVQPGNVLKSRSEGVTEGESEHSDSCYAGTQMDVFAYLLWKAKQRYPGIVEGLGSMVRFEVEFPPT